MGGVTSGFGGPVYTVCFTESGTEPGSSRLAAVVIWRRPHAMSGHREPQPLITPPADSSTSAPVFPIAPRLPWQPPDGWDGGRSDDGREVLYHQQRGVVRVLEREYPLPSTGEALLLLIDERATGAAAVGVHTLAAPLFVRPAIDRTLDKPARLKLMMAASRAENDTWVRALGAHPAMQAFLTAGPGEDAT